jgi:AraC family ethanolamine operon transcriptional activator
MEAARNRLLAAVSRLLLAMETTQVATENATIRTRAYQRARLLIENTELPVPVEELAGKVGVTRRCLEIGFKEVAGVSPQTFMQRSLLNKLHRELLHADPAYHNVTNIALNFGFAELGRTAGRYRELFGELPSKTLASNAQRRVVRYLDLLDGTDRLNHPDQ